MTALCKILLMYVYNTNILNTHLFSDGLHLLKTSKYVC